MADSPHSRGTGRNDGGKKRGPDEAGDAEAPQQEESEAAGREEAPADPGQAPRPPRLYGYDPDQLPEPR
jgi:hypothetical protein